MRYKVFTGPVYVKEIAEGFQKVSGVSNVIAGTEHVFFDFEGDEKQFEIVAFCSDSYNLIRRFVREIKKVNV